MDLPQNPYLFVYGTLRRGAPDTPHRQLLAAAAHGVFQGKMFKIGVILA